jgi:hypothetical protein
MLLHKYNGMKKLHKILSKHIYKAIAEKIYQSFMKT